MVAAARYADQYDGYPRRRPRLQPAAGGDRQHLRRAAVRHASRRRRPADLLDRLHAGRAHAGRQRRARALRRARRRCRRHGAGHGACQAAFEPRARRADLHRRTRRHLPERGAEDRASADLRRARRRAAASRSTRASRTTPASAPATGAFWEFTAPLALDSGAVGFIFRGAAGRPGDLQRPDLRADAQHRHADAPQIYATNATYTESAMSFMTPPNPTDLAALREPRREDDRLPRHQRSDLLDATTPTAWYDAAARANGGDAVELRALLPGAGHEPLLGRAGHRPVRHADAAGGLGRAGPGARSVIAARARRRATRAASTPKCPPTGRPTAPGRCAPIRVSQPTPAATPKAPPASPADELPAPPR